MADCQEAATTRRCFNTASRQQPGHVQQISNNGWNTVESSGLQKRLHTPARLVPGGGEGGNKLGGVFFQSDVQLISSGNFNSTTNHNYAVPEISSQS
jgi:hypothetical protein